jgi:dihydroneopterin aldolase
MDRILLVGIRCALRVGVSQDERSAPQECLVDVELATDLGPAARSDTFQDTLDYGAVFNAVHEVGREKQYCLLEGYAGALYERLRGELSFQSILIRVKKLNPPLDGSLEFAGIELHRDHGDQTKGNR